MAPILANTGESNGKEEGTSTGNWDFTGVIGLASSKCVIKVNDSRQGDCGEADMVFRHSG